MRIYSETGDTILSVKEQEEIISWVIDYYHQFDLVGYNKWRLGLKNTSDYPKVIDDIKERIIDIENLSKYNEEPIYNDIIEYSRNGADFSNHKDVNSDGMVHVRFDVYVKLPKNGGLPIYNGELINVKERQYLCCRAGIDYHSRTTIKQSSGIIISYGFLMPYDEIGNILYNF